MAVAEEWPQRVPPMWIMANHNSVRQLRELTARSPGSRAADPRTKRGRESHIIQLLGNALRCPGLACAFDSRDNRR